MLKVIKGHVDEALNKKLEQRKQKAYIYRKLYYKSLCNCFLDESTSIRIAFYGIKYVTLFPFDTKTTLDDFLLMYKDIQTIINIMEVIPLKDIINAFPIIKEYEGERFESKDYFSTMDYLKNIDVENPLGEEIYNFFFNYYNNDIMNFSIRHMLIIDKIRKANNQQSLMEEFISTIDDKKQIHTYTYHEKEGYMYDNQTGKTFKVRKPKKRIPKYIKVVQ